MGNPNNLQRLEMNRLKLSQISLLLSIQPAMNADSSLPISLQPVQASLHPGAGERAPFAVFVEWTNLAFKAYHSLLALSRSPLANSKLVVPALVLDDVSPTADERGRALQLLLRWAVAGLAPGPIRHPLGRHRPFDDPTWRDPLWWRYNILRHRYLEPLHPDEFVDGGRYTETLIALTGIPTADTFFHERNRAIREIAQRLQEQAVTGDANEAIQQLALNEMYHPLHEQADAETLLGIAATFLDVFPRALLLQMAAREHLVDVDSALHYLLTHRFLRSGDDDSTFLLSPVLQSYVYRRQSSVQHAHRHRQAADFFTLNGEALLAAYHWRRAGQWSKAAAILLGAYDELVNELQITDLRDALKEFKGENLSLAEWREIQIRICDLCIHLGQREEALDACRLALKGASEIHDYARIYRRMGKLYEKYNQQHALIYYQQAAERFTAGDPELVDLLKDRGWLHVLRREWRQAEADLQLALAQAPENAQSIRADIYDALASLNRDQKQFDLAIEYARKALLLREELGNLIRVADSFNNLGLLYTATHDYRHAVSAFEEAMKIYRKLNNGERTATALLNLGTAYHFNGQLMQAVKAYQESLSMARTAGVPLAEVRAHANLAEALTELDRRDEARHHWQIGHNLSSQAGFDDEVVYFDELRTKLQIFAQSGSVGHGPNQDQSVAVDLGQDEQTALLLAERDDHVTNKALMAEANISRATAARCLANLVQCGYLERHGKGRRTYYTLPKSGESHPFANTGDDAPSEAHLPVDLNFVQEVLSTQRAWLTQAYRIQDLALSTAQKPRLTIFVRFHTMLDLSLFTELESQLERLLKVEIHIKPIFDETGEQNNERQWLWSCFCPVISDTP